MCLIFEVLRLVSAVSGTASVVQTINKSALYGHLLRVKEKQLKKSFSSDWPIIAKPLVYQALSKHISDHIVLCELIIVLRSIVSIKATMAVVLNGYLLCKNGIK